MNRPMPSTVRNTSPSASPSTAPRSRKSSSFGIRQPSRNRRGGTSSRKNSSGSSSTRTCATIPIKAPSAICTSGRGSADGNMREAMPLTTTASNRNRHKVTICKPDSPRIRTRGKHASARSTGPAGYSDQLAEKAKFRKHARPVVSHRTQAQDLNYQGSCVRMTERRQRSGSNRRERSRHCRSLQPTDTSQAIAQMAGGCKFPPA